MEMEDELSESGRLKLEMHYETEEKTLQQLLKLENEFRAHYTLMLKELQLQKELTDRVWVLSQRYIILISTGPCCKYPDIYASPAEDVIISEYNEKLKLLNVSNCRIMKSLHALRLSCIAFEKLCSRLDMSVESPLIIGDVFHKPLAFFIELVSDLFKCFHAMILKLKYSLNQTDPYDCGKLDEYKMLLKPSEEFEDYFKLSMTYCNCLKSVKVCCGKPERDKELYKLNCKE